MSGVTPHVGSQSAPARKPTLAELLATPAEFVPGVGPQRAALLRRIDVSTVGDLIFLFPRDYQDLSDRRAIADLLADVLTDQDIRLDSDGGASRPFCYVSDTVLGLFHILLLGQAGHAYNVGETRETTILELARRLVAVAGKETHLSIRAGARQGVPPAARDSGHFDIGKIRRLGWLPRMELEHGLERTLASLRLQAAIPGRGVDADRQGG